MGGYKRQRFNDDSLNTDWSAETGLKIEDLSINPCRKLEGSRTGYPEFRIAYFRIPRRRLENAEGEYDFSLMTVF